MHALWEPSGAEVYESVRIMGGTLEIPLFRTQDLHS